ncbi:eukaryotic integral membrane protein-domain-containing protein [Dipodascopsis uninucleata]
MLRLTIPPLTKAVLVFSIVVSFIVAFIRYSAYFALVSQAPEKHIDLSSIYVSYLTVVPAVSIVFPWTFLTAAFIEQNLFTLTIAAATLYYAAKYCERVWGSAELAKFLVIVSIIPNFLVFTVFIVIYVFTKNPDYEFISIYGSVALQAGFLVAFKQLVPEHVVVLFRGMMKIRVKQLPMFFLILNIVIGFMGAYVNMLLAISGFFVSWLYLRFYRVSAISSGMELGVLPAPVTSSGSTGSASVPASAPGASGSTVTRGDASDTFSMANFFPDALAPLISVISTKTFNFLVRLHVCLPFSQEDIEASNLRNGSFRQRFVTPLPGSVRAEAERRRALALKALDQRLSQGKKEVTGLGETNFVPEEN